MNLLGMEPGPKVVNLYRSALRYAREGPTGATTYEYTGLKVRLLPESTLSCAGQSDLDIGKCACARLYWATRPSMRALPGWQVPPDVIIPKRTEQNRRTPFTDRMEALLSSKPSDS